MKTQAEEIRDELERFEKQKLKEKRKKREILEMIETASSQTS